MTAPLWLAQFATPSDDAHAPRPLALVRDALPGNDPDGNHDPDRQLIDRIRAGDETAFRTAWDRHHASLADFASRYVRSSDTALDVVQHVFFTLWRGRASFHPRGTLAAYLYASVRHRAWNVFKHDRIVQSHARNINEGPEHARNLGELTVEADELVAEAARILDTIPPRAREMLLMHREDGLTPAQIAAVLGVAPQTVYNGLAKATKALAEGLARWREALG